MFISSSSEIKQPVAIHRFNHTNICEEVNTTFKGQERFFMRYNMKIVSVFICNSEMKLPQIVL